MSSVVLPQPDGPMMATISPRGTAKVTPRKRLDRTLPLSYVFTTSCTCTMVSDFAAVNAAPSASSALTFRILGIAIAIRLLLFHSRARRGVYDVRPAPAAFGSGLP